MRLHTTTTIIREETDEEIEIEIEIEATYYAGRPATYLDPPEHPEVEITNASIDGENIELTELEYEEARIKILENPPHV